ncbi:RES family NAD+ phosphorylase [Minwuia sp.]|uniref:RES family NAD+ phosphorylase n=1 Tax=Minwuia sp. TaxID=2493630 RepID=UPI003A90147A
MKEARDADLLDALEALQPVSWDGPVWRATRDGRDPLNCGRGRGRWDDGSFDVLYTSLSDAGAVAEMRYHSARGQPIPPSKIRYRLYELQAVMSQALEFVDLPSLKAIGMDASRYGDLAYSNRGEEYILSQRIAEAAHFLGFDGLIVPNARHASLNAVIFCEQAPMDRLQVVGDRGLIDWIQWRDRIGF